MSAAGEEEVQDLIELEDLIDDGAEEAASPPSPCMSIPIVRDIAQSYSRMDVPVAILDADLSFGFANRAFSDLLGRFDYPRRSRFTSLFYENLGDEGVARLKERLFSADFAYSWKGRLSHKVKHASTEITKAFIHPVYPPGPEIGPPPAYSVFLDDVTEETQRTLRTMFLSLLEASKLKDNDTGAHIQRVNAYSRLIASALFNDPRFPAVDQDFLDDIGFLAAMHDVGKIGTPDDILNKSGPLTPWEWSIMREHTINGAYILSTYPNPMAKHIALSHHEMWDGNGYPYKLQGEMIPLPARIVSIADVYDALRMKRSYKPAYSHSVAVAKIRDWAKSHFDPRLVELFLSMQDEFGRIYESNKD
jgi:HD-GYP domain-containing protein (c-di-GMP phosphodiesterase class II)